MDQNPNPEDERILGSVLCAVAYTVRSCEEVQRYEGRALLTGLSERQMLALSALTASAAYTPSTLAKKQSAAVGLPDTSAYGLRFPSRYHLYCDAHIKNNHFINARFYIISD